MTFALETEDLTLFRLLKVSVMHTDFCCLDLEDSRDPGANFTLGTGSFVCMLINLMRHGMTPAGVPAHKKKYVSGRKGTC